MQTIDFNLEVQQQKLVVTSSVSLIENKAENPTNLDHDVDVINPNSEYQEGNNLHYNEGGREPRVGGNT